MRTPALIPLTLVLWASHALGQTSEPAAVADEKKWSFSLSANTYFVPDDKCYVQPTFIADLDWLHLEARYNYEDLETTSAWVGYNFSFGEDLTIDFTPMLGVVCGNTQGVAPGYELTVGWRRFELYTEGEYLIDTGDSSNSYFYTWSELTYSPLDWLRAGVVIQRTKAYESDLDIQYGALVGVTLGQMGLTAYLMDPGNDPFVVLGVGFEF